MAASNSTRKRDNGTQALGAHLSDVDGYTDGRRYGQQQRKKRRDQSAIDKRHRSEAFVHRVPVVPVEKLDSKLVQRQLRLVDQFPSYQDDDRKYRNRAKKNNHPKHGIRNAAAAGISGSNLSKHRGSRRLARLVHMGQRRHRGHGLLELTWRLRRIHRIDAIRHVSQDCYRTRLQKRTTLGIC